MSRFRFAESTQSLRGPRQRFNPRVAIRRAELWAGETVLLSAAVATVVFSFMWFA